MIHLRSCITASALLLVSAVHAQLPLDQSKLKPVTSISGPALRFDWPDLLIGVGSYEEGPTGLTIFKFAHKATAVVDVRGGAPGTINTDALRLGYGSADLNAIVFSGGSLYGEEAITAVATGLKDAGETGADFGSIGFVAGAIIYDFRNHRLNEIYPDRQLARATLEQLRPGVFPLGAQGAGRMAMQGGYLGCRIHSGEGGAFRQIGEIKIATFTVVNALGSIVDRNGQIVRCHRGLDWKDSDGITDLLARSTTGSAPVQVRQGVAPAADTSGPTSNTTISLVVTNRKMSASALQRLAVQVHSMMSRAIQPFSTADDGDTLYAVSTQEVDVSEEQLSNTQLGVAGSELMWDAVLASVPQNDLPPPGASKIAPSPASLANFAGKYFFGGKSVIDITSSDNALHIAAETAAFFDIPKGAPARLVPLSDREFYVPARYGTRIAFTIGPRGEVTGAVIDPGPWEQRGERLK